MTFNIQDLATSLNNAMKVFFFEERAPRHIYTHKLTYG